MATESRVLIGKLDNQNWGIWRRKLKALFLSKRLAGVIDGTDEDKDNSSQVLGLIQLHLSDAYLSMADDVATGKALWDKLEATFTAQNNARRLLLRHELNSLRKAPTESISEYIARAKELATNLEAVGQKPDPSEVTLSVLAGLPKEFSVLVTIMGTLKETQTLDEVLPALLQTEQQTRQEEDLFPMYGAAASVKSCYYCKKPGHLKASCPKLLNRLNQQCIRAVAY